MTTGGYLMGLDNGGSLIKCALFSLDGEEVASVGKRVRMDTPAPGFTERDTDAVWNANAGAIRETLALANVKGAEVLGIAVCGYGNGITLLDESGLPTYPTVVSTDARATDFVTLYAQNGVQEKVYAVTRQAIWAAQPIALLPWFRDHRPEVMEKTAHALFITDYVRYRLTGEICGEVTTASGTNLFNLEARKYDDRLFGLVGIPECLNLFPTRIADPAEIVGVVSRAASEETGLAANTPVLGGLFDIDACCASSGILADDTLCLVSGTWSINEYITRNISEGDGKYSTTISYLPDFYLIAESSPTSASNFDWYLDNVMGARFGGTSRKEKYGRCDGIVDSIKPEESDLVFVPYLYGSNSYPSDRGAFFNMSGYYNGDHMLRAVFEGIVFSSCVHVERLLRGRERFARARMSGGVAKSAVWTQMMADALHTPLEVVRGSELGALGAAMCAGIGCGAFADFKEAGKRMVRLSRKYEPNPAREKIYAEKFARFKHAVSSVDAFHQRAPGD